MLGRLRPGLDSEIWEQSPPNASGINDGAAALVIMEEFAALQQGLYPLACSIKVVRSGYVPPHLWGINSTSANTRKKRVYISSAWAVTMDIDPTS